MSEAKDKHFIKKPYYPGGAKALNVFIYKNLKMPKDALENNIEGFVMLRYTVDHKGNVADTRVISPLFPSCDKEAQRVLKMVKYEVPKQYKARVQFQKTIRIWFKPQKKTKPTMQSSPYNYIYTETKPKEQEADNKPKTKKKVYNYTIHIGK